MKSNFWTLMIVNSWRSLHWCINCQCRTDIDEAKIISSLQEQVKIQIEIQFRTSMKRNSNFWVSMLYIVLVKTFPLICINYQYRTDIDEAKVISSLQRKSKFNFDLTKYCGFPCCSTREDFSIDVQLPM